MIDDLLNTFAPHPCCGCGKLGAVLCDNCKYNIVDDTFLRCLLCGKEGADNGLCSLCRPPYARAWCVGERVGELKQLIDDFKFENKRAASLMLAELLDECIPHLPLETMLVPVPTIPSHVRQRGYDHAFLIAKYFAKRRQLSVKSLINRTTSTVQRGHDRNTRRLQAEKAFTVRNTLSDDIPYLLIDDVVTTGATLHYAALALQRAGARTIWAGVIARQPLD